MKAFTSIVCIAVLLGVLIYVHRVVIATEEYRLSNLSKNGTYKILNQSEIDKQLQLKGGDHLCCDFVNERTTDEKWVFQNIGNSDIYHIRSFSNPNNYLNIEGDRLKCSKIENGWLSAQWAVVSYGDSVRIQNMWKVDQSLNIESGELECSSILSGWLTARWQLIKVN